jgi:hypothetical protein
MTFATVTFYPAFLAAGRCGAVRSFLFGLGLRSLAQNPPMGWNSCNKFASDVTARQLRLHIFNSL